MPQYIRHTDTFDPDDWVQVGLQWMKAADVFGQPGVWVPKEGACKGDQKQEYGTRGL